MFNSQTQRRNHCMFKRIHFYSFEITTFSLVWGWLSWNRFLCARISPPRNWPHFICSEPAAHHGRRPQLWHGLWESDSALHCSARPQHLHARRTSRHVSPQWTSAQSLLWVPRSVWQFPLYLWVTGHSRVWASTHLPIASLRHCCPSKPKIMEWIDQS